MNILERQRGVFHSTQVTELEQFGYLSWCREQTNNNVFAGFNVSHNFAEKNECLSKNTHFNVTLICVEIYRVLIFFQQK